MVGFLYGIYPYYPNTILPPLFAVIVSLLSVVILYRCVRHRWWHFGIVMLWASLVWVSGFIMRAISIHQPSNLGLFVAQYVLIFSGPPLYAASESFILGRLLGYLPYHAPFHPGRVLYVFGILCAAIEALAINGASIASNSNASPAAIEGAQQRIKASLIMQEFLEAAFCGFVAYIEYKCRKARLFPRNVKIICRVIYTTSLMMMVRCIVRTVEGFATGTCDPHAPDYNGWCGPVQENEWFLWVFEVANITVFVAALAIWHPSRYLPGEKKIYLDPVDGVTERMGPGFTAAQGRTWWETWIDPLDIGGWLQGKNMDRFWERDNEAMKESFAARGRSKRLPWV